MTNKMNLKKRILLGYLMPLLLMLGVALAVYWNTHTLQRISDALDQSHIVLEHVRGVHRDLIAIQRATRGYILLKNDTSRNSYAKVRSQLHEGLGILNREVTDPTQQENLRQFSDFSRRLESAEQEYFELVDAGKASKAAELFRSGKSIGLSGELDALAQKLERREGEIVAVRHKEEAAAMAQLLTVAGGATALALILALLLGAWIAARISHSIGQAIAGMSSSSTEIAAAVSETTSTVEELGASARQSASQAESMATEAKQSLEVTQEGIRLANRVSTSMTQMKQKVGSVAEQILHLSEQAAQIGGIAKVVGELAGETNMLALNAAVEAARAGEHGKGFAVVASEVRKLADQSKKSAERANALVAEIQKATNSAVMVTEEGSRTAEDVAGIIDKTIEAFGSISATVNGVSVSMQQVLLNSRQQAAALGQVTEAMKNLAAGTAQLNSVALNLKTMV